LAVRRAIRYRSKFGSTLEFLLKREREEKVAELTQIQQPGDSVVRLAPSVEGSANEVTPNVVPDLYKTQLEDAEALLQYAADTGFEVDDAIRNDIFAARDAAHRGWSQAMANRLLAALTVLSAKLKPVTGPSLRACIGSDTATKTIKLYRGWAVVLGILIVPYSVVAFAASATCEAIRKDIDVANGLAVSLVRDLSNQPADSSAPGSTQAPAPADARARDPEEIKNLQLFAATIRDIRARTTRLSHLDFGLGHDFVPGRSESTLTDPASTHPRQSPFELSVPLDNFPEETTKAIRVYQTVRFNAQSTQESVTTGFGALTSCVLPMLYALLGACAYLIRMFEGQVKARTFTGTDRPTAHFLIAGIGGFVVGLFGDFGATHGAVLQPLALAFLVGYGVDVFFYFLDGILQTFSRSETKTASVQTAKA
jgi:hypothetical protein